MIIIQHMMEIKVMLPHLTVGIKTITGELIRIEVMDAQECSVIGILHLGKEIIHMNTGTTQIRKNLVCIILVSLTRNSH